MLKKLFTFLSGALLLAAPIQAQDYKRIAVAGGDITEIIYALGAGDRIIAVDSTSRFPAQTKDKAQIGYVRALSAEGVLSISPDLLIGAEDAGPANVIDNLKSAGLAVALAPLGKGADRVPIKIKFVGETLGMQDKAAAMIADYTAKMDSLAAKIATETKRPRVVFILSVRDGAPVVGGRETSANDIIELSGGINAAGDFKGWKPMNSEALIAANPDYIVMSGTHATRLGGGDKLLARPDIQQTTAGKQGRLIEMDAMLLLGFGPRTPDAVKGLMDQLYATRD